MIRTNKWVQKSCGYKINVQKSLVYEYIKNEQFEKEIKKITFTIASKILSNKTYKMLLKEIKEDTNKWKEIPCS